VACSGYHELARGDLRRLLTQNQVAAVSTSLNGRLLVRTLVGSGQSLRPTYQIFPVPEAASQGLAVHKVTRRS
jgi:hypothetical protein